jgi:hypothetical protein
VADIPSGLSLTPPQETKENKLVVRQSPVSRDMKVEAEEATTSEAITSGQLVNMQQTEKT